MRSALWILALACVFCVRLPASVLAETSNDEVAAELKEMKKMLQAQNELIQKQQARIEELERKVATAPAAAGVMRSGTEELAPPPVSVSSPEPTAPTAQPPTPAGTRPGALPGQIGSLLPEIGLIADITAATSEEGGDAEGNDRISAREIELVVGSNVDPYSRLDANLTFSDFEEAGVEEAYLTRWGLPADLTARFGRFFPKVGKQASIHRDSLPTIDEPLVIRRYFGSEGYNRTGADLSRIFEGVAGWLFQPSVGILEGGTGEGGTVFGATRRRPTIYTHLKGYKDLSESASLEFGVTHLAGSSDADAAFEVNVLGVDATYLNNLSPQAKLLLQSELFVQQRDEAFSIGGTTGETTRFDRHPWGAYALAEYRFAPQWAVGARADHVRRVDSGLGGVRHYDQGLSGFLTFYQSEWARWRLQFRHEERGPEPTDDSVMLQGTFAIGTHKHKIQ